MRISAIISVFNKKGYSIHEERTDFSSPRRIRSVIVVTNSFGHKNIFPSYASAYRFYFK